MNLRRFLFISFSILSTGAFAQNGRAIPIDSIQYVSQQELAKGNDDPIYYSNGNNTKADVVVIEGVVCPMHPGFYGLSTSRKSTILWQKNSKGWGGIEVMCDPGAVNYSSLADLIDDSKFYDNFIPGLSVKCTGQLGDYQGNSQLYLTGVESEVTSLTKTEIKPLVLKLDTFKNLAGDNQLVTGEKYEHMYVEFQNVTVVNRAPDPNGNPRWRWSIQDGNGLKMEIRDFSGYTRNDGNNDSTISTTFTPPSEGTLLEYIRGAIVQTGFGGYMLAPLVPSDIKEGKEVPPLLTSLNVTPLVPTSSDDIVFSITATDADGVSAVTLNVNTGSGWQQFDMKKTSGDDYEYTLAKQPNGTLIQYYIMAEDVLNYKSYFPNQTGEDSYIQVKDGGISEFKDIQQTPKVNGESLYKNVTLSNLKLTGIVTGSLYDYSGVVSIQNGTDAYNAIYVRTKAGDGIDLWERGDEIEITEATVTEVFGVTYLEDVQFSVKGFGNALPATIKTIPIDSASQGIRDYTEAYEGMLIEFTDVVVQDTLPDPASFNSGEWTIAKDTMDGTASFRVDDISASIDPSFAPDTLKKGQKMKFIKGTMYYSFGNFKLAPRDKNDIHGYGQTIGTTKNMQSMSYSLFPNPTNNEARLRLVTESDELMNIQVTDIAGRLVWSTNVQTSNHPRTLSIPTESFDNGTYVVTLQTSDLKESLKLLKN